MRGYFKRFPFVSMFAMLSLFMVVEGCGGGDDNTRIELGELLVTPNEVTFPATSVGENSSQYLTIQNVGTSTLTITEMSFSNPVFSIGAEFNLPIELEVGEPEQTFPVVFTPTSTEEVVGELTFRSNSGADVVILRSLPSTSNIRVDPEPISFGRVAAGGTDEMIVSVTNTGNAPMEVNNMFTAGSIDFSITAQSVETLPFILQSNEFMSVTITYSPLEDGFDEGSLIIAHRQAETDDSFENKMVDINANGAEPCISVTHEEGYDFGQRLIGQISEEIFTVTNCSDAVAGQPLIIDGMNWVVEHDWFGIIPTAGDLALDVDSLMADGTVEIEPQGSRNFTVTFAPTEEAVAEASFEILSNDEIKNPLDIQLRGLGSNNECPVAVATCTVRGMTAGSNELNANPLDNIDCDASQSYDADGAISSYNWEIIARPEGSTASFTPSGSVVSPSFFVDLAGRYTFRLNVFDEDNTPSCEPADVNIVAIPDEAIHIQLVWDTPTDSDQTDTIGTDVDLHFLHSNGDWNDRTWDCYYGNRTPNWGDPNSTQDDPSLDIDDTNGAGPENINLDEPEDGTQYRVGAHYYDNLSLGNSYATVRIYIDHVEAFEIVDKLLTNGNSSTQDMWDVASIDWPSRTVTRIDRVSQVNFRGF